MTKTKDTKSAGPVDVSSKLSKDAYRDIRKMIFLDEFRPGQQVSSRKLAERQEMSLTPVVQALKIFEHMGIVRHETNRGFFVEKITPNEVQEVYALRELIELSLVPGIIKKFDEDAEITLKKALDEYFEASRNKPIKVRLAKDIKFHMTLAEISGQTISTWILRYLYDLLYLRFDNDLISYRPNDVSGEEHQAIFDAVVSLDVDTAQKVLQDHIRAICRGMLKEMSDIDSKIDDFDF